MFDEAKRIQYDRDMYDERRHNGELRAAEKIGLEKGREEGMEKQRREIACRLMSMGMSYVAYVIGIF